MQVLTKQWSIPIIIIVIIVMLRGCLPIDLNSSLTPAAVQGELDLSHWDYTTDGPVLLKGQWAFYWNKLLTPDDFAQPDFPQIHPSSGWISTPDSWNDYIVNGEEIEGNGYATYRLMIHSSSTQDQLALRIDAILSAYRLWINGNLLASNGIVGTTRESMIPKHLPQTVFFTPDDGNMDIIVQVSNFNHRRGGMWDHIELGLAQQITDQNDRYLAFEMFIIGSLIIMGIYHIGLFALRRNDRSPFYFGAFCLIIGFRALFLGEAYWYKLFPNVDWEIGLRMEYILTYIGVPFFIKYISELYPRFSSKKISLLSFAVGIIYCSIVLATPTHVFTNTLISYHIIILLTVIYLLYILTLAILHREKGSILLSIGIVFYALTIVNDILYYNEIILTGDYTSIGLFVFIFAHSFVLSMKFSKAFSDVKLMTQQLKELNIDLESKVNERTRTLVEFNKYLTLANNELFRMETSRRHLLSNISHDLRTPITSIQGYIEAFLDGVVVDPVQQKKYLQLIHSKTLGLNRLIKDLFELSQLEAGQISFSLQTINIHQLMNDVAEKYETDIHSAGLTFTLQSLIAGSSAKTCVLVDPDRIDQVFSNLIFNALRFTPAEGLITVSYEEINSAETSFSVNPSPIQEILIKVKDTGSGIAEDKLPYIFDRFYKESDTRNTSIGGSGLGLAISKEIILSHGGRIWAESTPGEGSTFCFTLPVSDENEIDAPSAQQISYRSIK